MNPTQLTWTSLTGSTNPDRPLSFTGDSLSETLLLVTGEVWPAISLTAVGAVAR
jgi:hypothetical protein